MRYFLDTEFIENGKIIDLISIGIVAEDGREFYRQNRNCDWDKANEWVIGNVFPHLTHFSIDHKRPSCLPRFINQAECIELEECPWEFRMYLAPDIRKFCNPWTYGPPEFWGYYTDYDWVVLCQLFGTMMNLPKDWPMYCRDIKQWCDMLGNPKLPEQDKNEHHALADARWNKRAWEFLCATP